MSVRIAGMADENWAEGFRI